MFIETEGIELRSQFSLQLHIRVCIHTYICAHVYMQVHACTLPGCGPSEQRSLCPEAGGFTHTHTACSGPIRPGRVLSLSRASGRVLRRHGDGESRGTEPRGSRSPAQRPAWKQQAEPQRAEPQRAAACKEAQTPRKAPLPSLWANRSESGCGIPRESRRHARCARCPKPRVLWLINQRPLKP